MLNIFINGRFAFIKCLLLFNSDSESNCPCLRLIVLSALGLYFYLYLVCALLKAFLNGNLAGLLCNGNLLVSLNL